VNSNPVPIGERADLMSQIALHHDPIRADDVDFHISWIDAEFNV